MKIYNMEQVVKYILIDQEQYNKLINRFVKQSMAGEWENTLISVWIQAHIEVNWRKSDVFETEIKWFMHPQI